MLADAIPVEIKTDPYHDFLPAFLGDTINTCFNELPTSRNRLNPPLRLFARVVSIADSAPSPGAACPGRVSTTSMAAPKARQPSAKLPRLWESLPPSPCGRRRRLQLCAPRSRLRSRSHHSCYTSDRYSRLMHPVASGRRSRRRQCGQPPTFSQPYRTQTGKCKSLLDRPRILSAVLMGGPARRRGRGLNAPASPDFSALVRHHRYAVSRIRERDHRNGMKELVSAACSKTRFLPQAPPRPGMACDVSSLDGGWPAFPRSCRPSGQPYRSWMSPPPSADVHRDLERPRLDSLNCGRPHRRQRLLTGDDARTPPSTKALRQFLSPITAAASSIAFPLLASPCLRSSRAVNGQTEILNGRRHPPPAPTSSRPSASAPRAVLC